MPKNIHFQCFLPSGFEFSCNFWVSSGSGFIIFKFFGFGFFWFGKIPKVRVGFSGYGKLLLYSNCRKVIFFSLPTGPSGPTPSTPQTQPLNLASQRPSHHNVELLRGITGGGGVNSKSLPNIPSAMVRKDKGVGRKSPPTSASSGATKQMLVRRSKSSAILPLRKHLIGEFEVFSNLVFLYRLVLEIVNTFLLSNFCYRNTGSYY